MVSSSAVAKRRQKPETESVGWRLSKPLLAKARARAKTLGISITAYINLLLAKELGGES